MHKYGIVAFLLFLFFDLSGQDKKELTLETAILKQSSDLAPDDLKGIEWIDASIFVNHGPDGSLEIKSTQGDILNTIMPKDVNACISKYDSASVSRIRPMGWKSATTFYLGSGNAIFTYDYRAGECAKVLTYPKEASNKTFSESSGNLAYTMGNDVYVATKSDSKIRVTNHGEGAVSAGVAIHRSEFGIRKGLFWSEDGTKLGFYEMDESPVTEYPLANYDSIPGKASPIRYPMAGQASHHARVGVFDTKTKNTIYLNTTGPNDQYLTNFTFSPKGDKAYLAVLNRGQDHLQLNTYDSGTGEFQKTLFEETDDKYVEPENPPRILADGSFLWMSERDGYNHIYHYKENGELIGQVTRGDYDVLEVVSIDSRGKKLIIRATEGLMDTRLYQVDVKSGKAKKIGQRDGTYSVYADDGTDLIVKFKSKDVPGEITSYTASGKKVRQLLTADNPLDEYAIGDIDFPVISAKDGTPLQARLIKPHDFDPEKKYPVLVYLYGGPHAQMVRNDVRGGAPMWMFYAANRGYLVFTVDNRGSANRGLEFEQATFRNLGTVEMEDQLSGVNYLSTLAYADTSRMAVHGWSYGGFMATSLMLRNPGVFDVGVAGGPVTDWRMYEVMYGERYMDTPEENPEGYENADLKNYTENLEGKLLLIHGLQDNVVVPQHSYTLLESFIDEGKQVDFFVYPGYEHNVRGKDRVHLMTKVLDYIDLHLD